MRLRFRASPRTSSCHTSGSGCSRILAGQRGLTSRSSISGLISQGCLSAHPNPSRVGSRESSKRPRHGFRGWFPRSSSRPPRGPRHEWIHFLTNLPAELAQHRLEESRQRVSTDRHPQRRGRPCVVAPGDSQSVCGRRLTSRGLSDRDRSAKIDPATLRSVGSLASGPRARAHHLPTGPVRISPDFVKDDRRNSRSRAVN